MKHEFRNPVIVVGPETPAYVVYGFIDQHQPPAGTPVIECPIMPSEYIWLGEDRSEWPNPLDSMLRSFSAFKGTRESVTDEVAKGGKVSS